MSKLAPKPMIFLAACLAAGIGLLFAAGVGQAESSKYIVNGKYIPTYYVDVVDILAKNCISCHVVGGIAPFALDNPTNAVEWAERIAEVTSEEYMPPWPPGRDSPVFWNERRLGPASKQILQDWAKAGAPLGRVPRNLK
jgi:mono/diheme cytochrome c family protein